MKRMKIVATLLFLAAANLAHAELNVFACEPEWAALVKELGGNDVRIYAATTGLQDPHHIQARPSLIAKMRQADLVVCTGAELEIGWLPLLLNESGNGRVQPGQPGYFEAARYVAMMEVPSRLDRSQGDIHAAGNPHIQTDPRTFAKVAAPLARVMAQLDAARGTDYARREQAFQARWAQAMRAWQSKAAPLKGVAIAVQHDGFPYLENWLGLRRVAELEPKPGVDPSVSYLATILERLKSSPAKMVLRAAYQSDRPSAWLSEHAGIPAVALPFTVGGDADASDLYSLFDDTLNRLLGGLK